MGFHGLGIGQLIGVSALIGQTSASFLIHQHGFVGQLEPHSTRFFVFQTQRPRAGLNGEHAVSETFAMHMEKTWLPGIGLHSNADPQFTGQMALMNLLGNPQLGRHRGHIRLFRNRGRRPVRGCRQQAHIGGGFRGKPCWGIPC